MSYTIVADVCKGNGDCLGVCPTECIHLMGRSSGEMFAYVDAPACIDCGACLSVCPTAGAILDEWRPELQRSPSRSNEPPDSTKTEPKDKEYLDGLVLLSSAMTCSNNSDYDGAIKRYSLAIQLFQRWAARVSSEAGYDAASEANSLYMATLSLRGDAYKEKGDFENALVDYNDAIRLHHAHVQAYMNRADLYERMGHRTRAIDDYRKALALGFDMLPQYEKRCRDALKRLGTMH